MGTVAGAAPRDSREKSRTPHIPAEGSKQYQLLSRLLAGERIDPFTSLMEMNLLTVNARASELRGMGWPVQSKKEPHPKLRGEKIVVYYFDAHFRRWIGDNPGAHPNEYPGQEGRGKFAKDTKPEPDEPKHRRNRLQTSLGVLIGQDKPR